MGRERLAVQQLEDGKPGPAVVSDVMQRDDAGMAQARGRLGLALEHLERPRAIPEEPWHLDRDLAVEPAVVGAKHRRHPARREPLAQLVAIIEHGSDREREGRIDRVDRRGGPQERVDRRRARLLWLRHPLASLPMLSPSS
jgi:hypothetical protein